MVTREQMPVSKTFARYAWFTLFYNVAVIMWGVFLRASKSGDGCGQHWLTCQGEVIPSAPELKTVIEYSHRMMTAIDGIVMLVLLGWAIYIWTRNKNVQSVTTRNFAIGSFIFVITEALVGAGLVLTGNTALADTAARPYWMAGHLVNTFILLTFLTLTARSASGGRSFSIDLKGQKGMMIIIAILAILLVGLSGSVAALASMLFPSETLADGLAKDLSPVSSILLKIRPFHPLLSILTSVYLIFLGGWLRKASNANRRVIRWSNALSIVIIIQVAFGAATLLMLAPVVMQVGHLLLADVVWIIFVLLVADFWSDRSAIE